MHAFRSFILAVAAASMTACGADRPTPTVAAASDLNAALPEIATAFTKETSKAINIVFGSSGNFAQQIANGAPFEVFLSADERYVERVKTAGLADGDGKLYATGRIGLFVPTGSPIPPDDSLNGLREALRRQAVTRFAIANPEHAPYGRAAQEALTHAGIWDSIRTHLVLGDNVAQATQFATAGSAQGGIIPLSLASTEAVKLAGTFVLLPESWHQPLRQRAVVLRGAGTTARAFFAFLQTRAARDIFRRYGFRLPNETP